MYPGNELKKINAIVDQCPSMKFVAKNNPANYTQTQAKEHREALQMLVTIAMDNPGPGPMPQAIRNAQDVNMERLEGVLNKIIPSSLVKEINPLVDKQFIEHKVNGKPLLFAVNHTPGGNGKRP